MASLLSWSWIFIISIRPGFTLPVNNYHLLAKRALQAALSPPIEVEEPRTNFIAAGIAGAVIVIAVIAGVLLIVSRQKVVDAEAGLFRPVDRPTWSMVENDKGSWWRNLRWQPSRTEDPGLSMGSGIERIKAAVSEKKGKQTIPLYKDSKSLQIPPEIMVSISKPLPPYPELKAPLYQPSQPTPTLMYGNKPKPRVPPKAVVNRRLSRSLIRSDRCDFARSTTSRRKNRLSRSALRHPFLSLKDSDALLASAPPKVVGVGVSKFINKPSPLRFVMEAPSSLTSVRHVLRPPLVLDQSTRLADRPSPLRSTSESLSRLASRLPVMPVSRPPPLDLDEEPRLTVRFVGSPKVRSPF
jgi:hypothetical protein